MKRAGNLYNAAMYYGLVLGVFYIIKFPLLVLGLTNPFTALLFVALTATVPFIAWRMVRIYRDKLCGQPQLGFIEAWRFGISLFLFAALPTAVVHYLYFRHIDGGYILKIYARNLEELGKTEGGEALAEQLAPMMQAIEAMTPSDITLQLLMQNVFYGSIIALAIAAFIPKKKKE